MPRFGDGGETGGSGARAAVLPPLPAASGKRDCWLVATTTTKPPSTTTSHATMCWSMLWSEGEIRTLYLPCHCLLRIRSSPNASLSWCCVSMSLCLIPALIGCCTIPFVLASLLNLLLLLRLNLARRTTARCSTKTTNRCLPYLLPTDTIMVRGNTGPCLPRLSIRLAP